MTYVIKNLFQRLFAWILALIATLTPGPVIPDTPAEPDPAPYLFASEQAYQDYYLYCTEEDPEPYTWSPEALAARDNVEKVLEYNGFSVTLFKNGTARINHLTKPVENVKIPSEVEGHSVAAIYSILPYNDYDTAGKIADKVKTATIPDTVEFIMEGAFEDLSNLRSITFGARVKYMQADAFRDCTLLGAVALPDALEEIPVCAFESCVALTAVSIGKNVRKIGICAFFDCPYLKKVTLPDGVTLLDQQCFALCKGLTYIYIPASVTSIDDNAFGKCDKLTIHGEKGSYAQSYAAAQGIPFKQGA